MLGEQESHIRQECDISSVPYKETPHLRNKRIRFANEFVGRQVQQPATYLLTSAPFFASLNPQQQRRKEKPPEVRCAYSAQVRPEHRHRSDGVGAMCDTCGNFLCDTDV